MSVKRVGGLGKRKYKSPSRKPASKLSGVLAGYLTGSGEPMIFWLLVQVLLSPSCGGLMRETLIDK